MALTTPQWLAQRGGRFEESTIPGIWLVHLNNDPQYRLIPVPAASKFACDIIQTTGGKKLGNNEIYPTLEDALRGGLEHLRSVLGW
jgi:hypothetical protein